MSESDIAEERLVAAQSFLAFAGLEPIGQRAWCAASNL
jgi:hypothetical protein